MAQNKKNGMLHYIDESGNVYVLYPITTLENVAGTGKLLLSEDGKTIKTLDGTEIKVSTDDNNKYAPAYTYGTEDLTPGVSPLPTGTLHFVYE